MALGKIIRAARRKKYCAAVIVAAGTASRMGGIDKVMAPIGGEPMILRTVRRFETCDAIQEIVVVTREDLLEPIRQLCRDCSKLKAVVQGGASRQQSVELGLQALSKECRMVAVQDGARPFVSDALICRTVEAAANYGAAAPAIPVKDTIKVVQNGFVKETPDRNLLRAVQTPQVFDLDMLRGALVKAAQDGVAVTDDCSAAEHLGMSVQLVEGEETNIKVTTPMDLRLAEMILEEMV